MVVIEKVFYCDIMHLGQSPSTLLHLQGTWSDPSEIQTHWVLNSGSTWGKLIERTHRIMSHEPIYRQPDPGNFKEEKPFTFKCSQIFLWVVRQCSKNYSFVTKVVLQPLQLVASKLLVKVASCEKALRLPIY